MTSVAVFAHTNFENSNFHLIKTEIVVSGNISKVYFSDSYYSILKTKIMFLTFFVTILCNSPHKSELFGVLKFQFSFFKERLKLSLKWDPCTSKKN